MPTPEAYARALERAYAEAALDPALVGYVETHGSGHPIEDRIETEALCAFFAPRRMAPERHLGSVKADIGHAGAAAALASVTKAALLSLPGGAASSAQPAHRARGPGPRALPAGHATPVLAAQPGRRTAPRRA